MRQGEIWLVEFEPSVGHEYQKDRPAIVASSDKLIKKSNVITVVPLTSNTDNINEEDVLIEKNSTNNLYSDSVIKTHHINTFDKRRFHNDIGKLKPDILSRVMGAIKNHFDI